MKGKVAAQSEKSMLAANPLSTYSQRTFNTAIGSKSPVQPQVLGSSATGTVPGGRTQGSTNS